MKTVICSIVETRKGQFVVNYLCDYCLNPASNRKSHFDRYVRHYCGQNCRSEHRKILPKHEQPTWRGGVSQAEAHRRWKIKNPCAWAHLKARRYAREKGAEGSHTLEQWQQMKQKHLNCCANCKEEKPLTKDHIIPLSEGGSDYIENIQPLCRNCNSRKWKHIQNPELLEKHQ